MSGGPAAGGGRWLSVPPERLEAWVADFGRRHGAVVVDAGSEVVTLLAADGTRAECAVPFGPLCPDESRPDGGLAVHGLTARVVGVLLVRRGGHAAGVFDGSRLVRSKVGARRVQGRSAAGGWSQQRFARRRDGQARVAAGAAADVVSAVVLPEVHRLDAMVTGGDRGMVDAVLADPRLAALLPLVTGPLLDVPDPGRAVLEGVVERFRSVRIRLVDVPP